MSCTLSARRLPSAPQANGGADLNNDDVAALKEAGLATVDAVHFTPTRQLMQAALGGFKDLLPAAGTVQSELQRHATFTVVRVCRTRGGLLDRPGTEAPTARGGGAGDV